MDTDEEVNIWTDPDFDLLDAKPPKTTTKYWWNVTVATNKSRYRPI